MPSNIVKSFAQKTGKSEAEVEKLWNKAKEQADKKDDLEKDSDSYWAYVTGILKNMLSIKENVDMDKQQERRALTRQFVQKVVDGQKFDAAADLREMIRLSKEIRYDKIAATVEI
jgi:hypothetical protein